MTADAIRPWLIESGGPQPAAEGVPVGLSLHEMERKLILRTLDRTGGNRTRTAQMLGVSVRTIRNKLNLYDQAKAEVQTTPA